MPDNGDRHSIGGGLFGPFSGTTAAIALLLSALNCIPDAQNKLRRVFRGCIPVHSVQGSGPEIPADEKTTFIFVNDKGDRYEGRATRGWPQGKGSAQYMEGYVYEGDWHNGRWHGAGILKHLNHEKAGIWYKGGYHGACLDRTVLGKPVIVLENGAVYQGDVSEGNIPNGQGVRYSDNGMEKGFWLNGEFLKPPAHTAFFDPDS